MPKPDDAQMWKVGRAVREALASYRCAEVWIEDGQGLPLVDVLTPKGDDEITRGMIEMGLLEDAILGAIGDALAAAPEKPVACPYCEWDGTDYVANEDDPPPWALADGVALLAARLLDDDALLRRRAELIVMMGDRLIRKRRAPEYLDRAKSVAAAPEKEKDEVGVARELVPGMVVRVTGRHPQDGHNYVGRKGVVAHGQDHVGATWVLFGPLGNVRRVSVPTRYLAAEAEAEKGQKKDSDGEE